METDEAELVEVVHDDSWRQELCPDCGLRLLGLDAWRDHRNQHGWGSDWFAARIRAARPGETVRIDPDLFATDPEWREVRMVDDSTWKAGVPA